MQIKQEKFGALEYCLMLPDDFDEKKTYPTVFFTHGAGSRGSDLSLLAHHVILEKMRPVAPDTVIWAPQCAVDTWFDVFENLISLAEYAFGQPYTDPRRFYGVGVSMGGYAMVQLMQSRPHLFAAGLICCGGGMYWNAERLKDIPLRLFHGARDTIVYPEESRRLADKIAESGGKVTLTVYPDCDHDCWNKTFDDTENTKWLLTQEKQK